MLFAAVAETPSVNAFASVKGLRAQHVKGRSKFLAAGFKVFAVQSK